MATEPCSRIRNHHFPARVEPVSYSEVYYSCGYSVAIFLLKDDGKSRRAAAHPWCLRTHEVRRDGRWEAGPAPHTQVCARTRYLLCISVFCASKTSVAHPWRILGQVPYLGVPYFGTGHCTGCGPNDFGSGWKRGAVF